ncbi:MAG: methylenetetrahydrofolate reductase [Candidatus Thorarchaeota archaeon]
MLYKSRLESLLSSNRFVVTCELGPPRGSNAQTLTEKVACVRDYCDAINVTDSACGVPSLDTLASSVIVIQSGAEPVMQISGRDRNRIQLQSLLYGAYALGVRNVLFVTGDHLVAGFHVLARTVFDFDSIQGLEIARILMGGIDLAGEELDGAPEFYLGATFDPYEKPIENQLSRLRRKHDAGAEFFQTQAIFDLSRFEDFMDRIGDLDIHVLAGVVPVRSPEAAEFMNQFVPGLSVPHEIIDRLVCAGAGLEEEEQQEAYLEEAVSIAVETIHRVRRIDGVSGIHIMAVGCEEIVPEIVRRAGLSPRPR